MPIMNDEQRWRGVANRDTVILPEFWESFGKAMSVKAADLTSSSNISVSTQPTLYNNHHGSALNFFFPPPSHDTPALRGGSPSSSFMTIRRADAYNRVPVLAIPTPPSTGLSAHMLQRRSSRLSRWLSELHTPNYPDVFDLSDVDPIGTQSNPYLAYPHMNMAALRRSMDDADSMHDYVIVDEDIAQECPPEDVPHEQPSHGTTPIDIASPRSTIRMNNNPQSSLRHFHLSRRSVSPSPKTTAASRTSSRLSMFHRSSRGDLAPGSSALSSHSRSTSLQTSLLGDGSHTSATPRASSWRWRPSVLGHFSSVSIPDTDAHLSPGDSLTDHSRSRPSMSSSHTCSSITTPTTLSVHDDGESPVPSTPPSKPPSLFGSVRLRSHAGGMVSQPFFKTDSGSAPSPPLRSLYPASAPHLPERQMVPPLSLKGGTIRSPFMSKSRQSQLGGLNQIFIEEPDDSQPRVLFAGRPGASRLSLPALGSPTRHFKKRKLVVSGIALNDTKRLDAIQKWCQSFGEVDQITRMPNGDLHVSFQKAEVADTVCRVRAKVQIAGVGSVHLSWITGSKRT